MTDAESTTVAPEYSTATTMEPQAQAQDGKPSNLKEETEKMNNLALQIWPPTQRTRDAVIKRLIETLSSQSVISKRYGTISEDEAASVAKSIEEEAFSGADASFTPDSDGIEILQAYSKEISKRMLETVKARAGAAPAASPAVDSSAVPAGSAGGEEVASATVEAEA